MTGDGDEGAGGPGADGATAGGGTAGGTTGVGPAGGPPADGGPTGGPSDPSVGRRQVLTAAGGALAAGLAGCSGVTSQEFAATPVHLPEAVREEIGLAEVFADSQTTTRQRTVGGRDVEVTVTSQFAGYGRSYAGPGTVWSAPRPTLVERFADPGRETTPGLGSAIIAVASDLGIEEADPKFVEGDTTVGGDEITFVVPEWARHDGGVRLEELMALHHADALPVDELTSSGGNNYLVDLHRVVPDRGFDPRSSGYEPDERWVAGHEGHWLPDDPSQLRCLVCLGERSPAVVFDVDEMPGRKLDAGETVSAEDTILFAPAPKESPLPDPGVLDPAAVFDAGHPTPTGGPTFGLGVLATPNAEIAGEPVSPLARMGTRELLTSDVASGVLSDAGLADTERVEWLRGPELGPNIWATDPGTTVLGEEVAIETLGGVVSGRNGPWAVAVHVAKATPDDVVVPAAMHRRPVGTPDGRELFGDGSGFVDQRWTTRGIEFTAEVVASLQSASGGA